MGKSIYARNKENIYSWRANNPEQNRLINRLSKRRCDAWKRIQLIYLNILLN